MFQWNMKRLLLVFLLSGCAGKPWMIPSDMPQREAQRRHYECLRDAEYAHPVNRQYLFDACMKGNGFSR